MTTEVTLVRLPVRLSDLVDEVVGQFGEQHVAEGLQAHRRYHGADLWLIFRHEPVGEGEPAFLTRRVTIAAYSDDPDNLRFIPDIVVTRPKGRFMLQPDGSQYTGSMKLLPIGTLHLRLLEPERTPDYPAERNVRGRIAQALRDAWSAANELQPHEATQLIP